MKACYFEDLHPGFVVEALGSTITEDEIIRFGLEWDPQPMHTDKRAAAETMHGGLIASGMQTLLLSFRLCVQTGVFSTTAVAGLGLDAVRFVRPIRPDTGIRVRLEVVECRQSQTRGDIGIVTWSMTTKNDSDEVVLAMKFTNMIAMRGGEREGGPAH